MTLISTSQIVGVAPGSRRVERRHVRLVHGRGAFPALRQVGVGEEMPPNGDEVAFARRQVAFSARGSGVKTHRSGFSEPGGKMSRTKKLEELVEINSLILARLGYGTGRTRPALKRALC